VGTSAVQIAKALGAHVTAVCSGRNLDLVRSLGADDVIDYTSADYTSAGRRFDLIFDTVGNRSLSHNRRALLEEGVYVSASGGNSGMGWLMHLAKMAMASLFTRQKLKGLFTNPNHGDLVVLRDMAAAGTLTPVVERSYPLANIAEALQQVGEGHARGQTVIQIAGTN
jgi:NADPH:quinone reductase-like Zn-dependent oxidoreductase